MATTMNAGFPVLLKNHDQVGVSEVVVVDDDHEGLNTVEDLISRLNKKLQDAASSAEDPRFQYVTAIRLYGTALRKSRPLAPLLLDRANRSPRLVASTRSLKVPTISGEHLTIQIITGKQFDVAFDPTDRIVDVKEKVCASEGIPPEHQRHVHKGMPLEDDRSLGEYGVEAGDTVIVVLCLRGGGGRPRLKTFADVSNDSLLVEREFSDQAPAWRVCDKGLNVEGRCETPCCSAFKKMVISPQRFIAFNLMEDKNATCPICHEPITPVTCGFYDCVWKFEGVQERGDSLISSPWKQAVGEKYHRFDADESHGSTSWKSLLIIVKSGDTKLLVAVKQATEGGATESTDDFCSICWSDGGEFMTTRCHHRFHSSCMMHWSMWCHKAYSITSCPLCRGDTI